MELNAPFMETSEGVAEPVAIIEAASGEAASGEAAVPELASEQAEAGAEAAGEASPQPPQNRMEVYAPMSGRTPDRASPAAELLLKVFFCQLWHRVP